MTRGLIRLACGFVLALLLLGGPAVDVRAHEGYPIILEAKYTEIKKGAKVKRMVFVNGHAHYPNGTKIAVGIRLEDQQQYIAWYNAAVKNQAFIVEMGPWNKEFASGMYIIEAWFIWERQHGAVQNSIKKAEEGLERGIDNCDPEVVKARTKCKTKQVFGATVVQVGTPGRFIVEEEEARTFLQQVHEGLSTIFTEIQTEQKSHMAVDKAPEVNVDSWKTKVDDWMARLAEADTAVVQWHQAKITVRHQKAYTAAVNSIMHLQGLIGAYGDALYQLTNEFLSGTPENVISEVKKNLDGLAEDLKPTAEEQAVEDEGSAGEPK